MPLNAQQSTNITSADTPMMEYTRGGRERGVVGMGGEGEKAKGEHMRGLSIEGIAKYFSKYVSPSRLSSNSLLSPFSHSLPPLSHPHPSPGPSPIPSPSLSLSLSLTRSPAWLLYPVPILPAAHGLHSSQGAPQAFWLMRSKSIVLPPTRRP